MKVLKQSMLFSLASLLSIALIFSSCNKENELIPVQTENLEALTQSEKEAAAKESGMEIKLALPIEITNQGEEAIQKFIEEASQEDIRKYQKSAIIADFLKEKGMLKVTSREQFESKSFSDMDLSEMLDVNELRTLNNKIDELQSQTDRGCYYAYYLVDVYYYCGTWGGYNHYCYSHSEWRCCALICY